jgi:hypothetical protein
MSLTDDGESEFKMKEFFCERIGVNKHLTMPIKIKMMFSVSMMTKSIRAVYFSMIDIKQNGLLNERIDTLRFMSCC